MTAYSRIRKSIFSFVAVALLAVAFALPARAAVDEQVLADFFAVASPPASAARVAGGSVSAPRDGTVAFLNVVRNWDQLRQETRDTLSPWFRIQGRQGAGRTVYLGGSSCVSVLQGIEDTRSSAHFTVHYTTSSTSRDRVSSTGSGNTPDYVINMLAYAEEVWAHEVGALGFDAPPLGSTGKYNIYLCDQFGRSGGQLLGLTSTDVELSNFVAESHIELDNDYSGVPLPSTETLADFIRVSFAHEFFHAIQFGMNWKYPSSWFIESTAVWMEDEAVPSSNDYLTQYLGTWFINPSVSIDHFSGSDTYAYGSGIFFRFITEHITGGGGMHDLWQIVRAKGTDCDPTNTCPANYDLVSEIPQISQYLTSKGTSFQSVFRRFGAANFEKDYVDGRLAAFPTLAPSDRAAYPSSITGVAMSHLSSIFYRFLPADRNASHIVISFTGASTVEWGVAVVAEHPDGTYIVTEVPVSGGIASYALDGFGTSLADAVVIISNLGTTTAGDGASFDLSVSASAACANTFTTRLLSSGWNMIAFPITPQHAAPVDELPGVTAASIFSFDAAAQVFYTAAQTGFTALGLPGVGYWLNLTAGGTLSPTGCAQAATTVDIKLSAGWNLIGNPFNATLAWDDAHAKVLLPGLEPSNPLSQAQSFGWLDGRLYTWSVTSYTALPPNSGNSLAAWTGYWIYAKRALTLRLSQ